MKILNLLLVVFAFLTVFATNSFAEKKSTIIQQINETETVKIYFIEEDVSEGVALPEGYATAYGDVVAELNKVFKVEKFVLGSFDDVPKKTEKLLGEDIEVEDWAKSNQELIVFATVDVGYETEMSLYIEALVTIVFIEIVEEKVPLKFINPMGARIYKKGEVKSTSTGDKTTLEQYKEQFPPESMIEPLKAIIPGSLDKFYAKQKKKFDKANK